MSYASTGNGDLLLPQIETPLGWQQLLEGRVQLVDLRQLPLFLQEYLQGSFCLPVGTAFCPWAAAFIDYGRPLFLIGDDRGQVDSAIKALESLAFDKVIGWGCFEQLRSFAPLQRLAAISIDQFDGSSWQLIDVRTPSEWEQGHHPLASHLEMSHLPSSVGQLDRSRRYALQCRSGMRAAASAAWLSTLGFEVCYVE